MNPSDIKEQLKEQLNIPYGVDFADINEVTALVQNIVSLLLGAIAYSVVILLALFTALDVMYITIPAFRERVQAQRWDGTKKKYLRAVSRDAVTAVEQAETILTGKSAMSIYLGKRIRTYIISAVVLFMILGGIGYIRDILLNILVPIIQTFSN